MKIISKLHTYKFDIIWFLLTFFIIISINISYMYSRDRTLSTVEWNQFRLFKNLMYATSLNSEIFTKISQVLTIERDKKKQALFHIGFINKDECIENGNHTRNHPLICKNFPNPKAIVNLLKNKPRDYIDRNGNKITKLEFSTKELGIQDSRYEAYLIAKRDNTNKWIIAKKRYLYQESDFKKLYFFLTKRYFQTTSFSKKIFYTKFSTLTILLTSFIIWLLFKSKELKNKKEYKKLLKRKEEIESKIIMLDNQYNNLKNDIYTLEEEIRKEEILLASQSFTNTEEKKNAIEKIRQKTAQQTIKNTTLITLRSHIIQLEAETEVIENFLNEKRIKLKNIKLNHEYKKLSNNVITLKQLWRHEPTWTKRKQIETTVSLTKENLPFTLTQAFLSFESFIDKEIEKYLPIEEHSEILEKTLIKKIDIIGKYIQLPESTIKLYHDIRKARNKWIHGAIYPNQELLNQLLNILEKTDITPPL